MNTNRVTLIDSMRGFSLFGILLANMLIFQYGIYGKDAIHLFSLSESDMGGYYFLKVAVEGSFMPIFTFLFGYSMVKMQEGLKRKQLSVKRHFSRRFILLLAMGMCHGIFLWEGDILAFYGMIGFFLLFFFLNRKPKTLLLWAALLFLLVGASSYGSLNETTEFLMDKDNLATYVKESISIYGSGTYTEISDYRNNSDEPLNIDATKLALIFLLAPFATAPLFLLGMYAGKKGWFQSPALHQKRYGRLAVILIPISLLFKATAHVWPDASWAGIPSAFGLNLLSLGYMFGFAWVYCKLEKSTLMKAFESVGRLSLSNYLFQTVICTTIFYGYGLGQFGTFGMINGIALCTTIYFIQLVFSLLYLRKLKVGPVEQLLRMWTNLSWSGKATMKKTFIDNSNKSVI